MGQGALNLVWKRKFMHTTDSKHGFPVTDYEENYTYHIAVIAVFETLQYQ